MAYEREHCHEDTFSRKSTLVVDPFDDGSSRHLPSSLCIVAMTSEFDKIALREKNILLYFWSPSVELKTGIESVKFSQLPDCSFNVENSQKISNLSALSSNPLVSQILLEMNQPLRDFANLLPDRSIRISFLRH